MTRLPIDEAPRNTAILARIDGEWMILHWYETLQRVVRDEPIYDTDTYAPGWITGERHGGEAGMSISGRYITFEPTHFYHLPEEG